MFELQSNSEISIFLLTNWYEILVILAALAFLALLFKRKAIHWFDWLLLVVLLLSVLSAIWSPATGWTDIIGLRYGIGFIVFYFVARSLTDWKLNENLLRPIFYVAIIIALLQGLYWLMLPETAVWFFAKRDLAGDLPRLYGSMIGPNQLGTYVACLSLWLYAKRLINGWWLGLAFVVVVATFSRSALLGMISGLLVLAYQQRSMIKWKLVGSILVISAAILVLTVSIYPEVVQKTLVGSRHTEERVSAFQRSIDQFSQATIPTKLFGHGVTTAGPSTFVTDRVFVPENWFLQVAHELGVVGLLLLLTAVVGALIYLSKNGSIELTGVFVAVAVNSLFLHPLADNPTAAITIFVLLGAAINTQVRKRMLK